MSSSLSSAPAMAALPLSAAAAAAPPPPAGAAAAAADQESAAYFSELLSYSLERLSKEPELLRADQEALRRQAQDTAVGHYRSFIDTTACLADLRSQLLAASTHLDDLARDLPKLQAACDRFRGDAAAIATKRAANRQLYSACSLLCMDASSSTCRIHARNALIVSGLLSASYLDGSPAPSSLAAAASATTAGSHPAVLEVLEVPQLMDTCCRSANFDEALDLRAFVNKVCDAV